MTINQDVFILTLTANGQVAVFSTEGEEEISGWLFTSLEEQQRLPLTSVTLDEVIEEDEEKLKLVITTMNCGVLHAILDIKNDVIEVIPLPSPPHPITALSILHTSKPFHLTTEERFHGEYKNKHTLFATLSDSSIYTYD